MSLTRHPWYASWQVTPTRGLGENANNQARDKASEDSWTTWWFREVASSRSTSHLRVPCQWYPTDCHQCCHTDYFCSIHWCRGKWVAISEFYTSLPHSPLKSQWDFGCIETWECWQLASAFYRRHHTASNYVSESSYCFDGGWQTRSGNCFFLYDFGGWDVENQVKSIVDMVRSNINDISCVLYYI